MNLEKRVNLQDQTSLLKYRTGYRGKPQRSKKTFPKGNWDWSCAKATAIFLQR